MFLQKFARTEPITKKKNKKKEKEDYNLSFRVFLFCMSGVSAFVGIISKCRRPGFKNSSTSVT
jgi:hypothetical protein